MLLSQDQFIERWKKLGENQAPHAVDAAWRRYQQVQDPSYKTETETDDPSASEFRADLSVFLEDAIVSDAIAGHKFVTLHANTIPWTVTNLQLRPGQTVSTFATGRVWRSRELDLWLRPQFALWFKIGINGFVFNSTGHSNTFTATHDGELYVTNQFPGQFGEPRGGRLASPLNVYDGADGRFELLIVVWKEGVNVSEILGMSQATSPSGQFQLISQELERMKRDADHRVPEDWKLLWFLGDSSIYTLGDNKSPPCMHFKPYQNVGILQKNLMPSTTFVAGARVSWDWLISSLPSRLREDLTITHDYLSVAFEFENGRDLTYTWSWELPKEYGYWCPLPTWADREYHIVIRSGTDELGQWLSEERDLYADYIKFVEAGKEDCVRIPKQIVRAWFIAGNRWQRFDGEMFVKRLRIVHGTETVQVL